MTRCAVIGAGAWGTALSLQLVRAGHSVSIWAHEPDVADSITRAHANRFLPGVSLPEGLTAGTAIEDVVGGAEAVIVVTPSHVTREVAGRARAHVPAGACVVVASKGMEQGTLARMTTVVEEALGTPDAVALCGPSFAMEVARGLPTAVVAASHDAGRAMEVQRLFHAGSFRVYTQHDVAGVELGGAVKNVMAIATGVAEGLALGSNARAALITRGLAEMARLGVALGAESATFSGLAGMGDLVLTCTGELSRNRALGVEIGRGATLDAALAGRETVAEGVVTTRAVRALARQCEVSMPIVDAVHAVLFDGQSPRRAISGLLGREPRAERDG